MFHELHEDTHKMYETVLSTGISASSHDLGWYFTAQRGLQPAFERCTHGTSKERRQTGGPGGSHNGAEGSQSLAPRPNFSNITPVDCPFWTSWSWLQSDLLCVHLAEGFSRTQWILPLILTAQEAMLRMIWKMMWDQGNTWPANM